MSLQTNINANQTELHYANEAVYGMPPCDVPYRQIKYTGEGPKTDQTYTDSGEITGRGVPGRPAMTARKCDGTVNFELSASPQFLDIMAYALGAEPAVPGGVVDTAWTPSAITSSGEVDVKIVGGSSVLEDAGMGFGLLSNLKVGQYIRISGFTTVANNKVCRVKSLALGATPATITVEETLTAKTGESCKIAMGRMARNGGKNWSVSMIDSRRYVEAYQSYFGMCTDAFSLTLAPNALVTGSWGFAGNGHSTSIKPLTDATNTLGRGKTPITGATKTPSDNMPPLVTAEGVELYREGTGLLVDGHTETKEFSITISGLLAQMQVLNSFFDGGKARNTFKPELSFTQYFTDNTLLTLFENAHRNPTKFDLRLMDSLGNMYVISFPQALLGGWDLTAGSNDAAMEAKFGTCKVFDYTDAVGAAYVMQVDFFPGTLV